MWGKNELRLERSFVLDHFMNTFVARTDFVVNTGQHSLMQTNHIFKGKDDDNGMSMLRYFIKQSLIVCAALEKYTGMLFNFISVSKHRALLVQSAFPENTSKGAQTASCFSLSFP